MDIQILHSCIFGTRRDKTRRDKGEILPSDIHHQATAEDVLLWEGHPHAHCSHVFSNSPGVHTSGRFRRESGIRPDSIVDSGCSFDSHNGQYSENIHSSVHFG